MCLLELKIIFFFNRGPYFSLTIADIITKAALSTHVFKTLSVGPAGRSRINDFPHDNPMFNQLSHPYSVFTL